MNTILKYNTNRYLLSGNALKVIAAVSMLIDHIGFIFFPYLRIFRIIGRISFPIFAFMIAEGCRYTRNKSKYFLTIFALAVICQTAYYIFDKSFDMCILVTFSLSIPVIYALQYFKKVLFSDSSDIKKYLAGGIFIMSGISVYILNRIFDIDYGFQGCLVPVFASILNQHNINTPDYLKKLDDIPNHVIMMSIGLIILAMHCGGTQPYSLLAIPFLLLYSGERGKYKMKYFFYLFYPVHLAILQGVFMLSN